MFEVQSAIALKMNVNSGETQQGNSLPIVNNYEFRTKLETTTTTHWKCGKWRSYKCKVTATTCFSEFVTINADHCNEIVPGKPEARQHAQKMKEAVSSSHNLPNTVVIATELQKNNSENTIQFSK